MILTPEQNELLMACGKFNFPVSKCIIKLDIPENEADEFTIDFENPFSEISKSYEKGKIDTEFEIMEKLLAKIEEGGEGADEAAKALNSMRKYQTYNELLKEHFNL